MGRHAKDATGAADVSDGPDRQRRGWRWLRWPAIGLLVLAVGAGGVFVGRAFGSGGSAASGPGQEPVVEASPQAQPLPVGLPEATDSTGGTPTLLVAATSNGGPAVVMTAGDGLPDKASSAIGYRSVNTGISGGQVAAVLAAAFGVFGPVEATADGWTVGPSGNRSLVVDANPLFTWQFADTQVDPTPTATPTASPTVGTQAAATAEAVLEPDRAIELATTLLGGIGVDTDSIDWQVDRAGETISVTAWQKVGRSRTSLAWRVMFAPDGTVVSASGFSAGLDQVPYYPVVGARTAVLRTAQPGWSALAPRLVSLGPAGVDDPTAPASPAPTVTATGAVTLPALAVPVTTVTAEAADLDLAQYWQADGSLLILPSYLVTGTDGSRWTVLAVDGQYVDFVGTPARPAPSASPASVSPDVSPPAS